MGPASHSSRTRIFPTFCAAPLLFVIPNLCQKLAPDESEMEVVRSARPLPQSRSRVVITTEVEMQKGKLTQTQLLALLNVRLVLSSWFDSWIRALKSPEAAFVSLEIIEAPSLLAPCCPCLIEPSASVRRSDNSRRQSVSIIRPFMS